jgi:hypothetical protein
MHYIYEDAHGVRTIAPCTISTMAEVEGRYMGQRLVLFDSKPMPLTVAEDRDEDEAEMRRLGASDGRGAVILVAIAALTFLTTTLALMSLSMA